MPRLFTVDSSKHQCQKFISPVAYDYHSLGLVQKISCTLNSAAERGWKQNVMTTSNEPSDTIQCLFFAAIAHTIKVLHKDSLTFGIPRA